VPKIYRRIDFHTYCQVAIFVAIFAHSFGLPKFQTDAAVEMYDDDVDDDDVDTCIVL